MSTKGQQLWRKAKKIIPGGNQLLSKRSELFLPEQWPSYYRKAKGCRIWDLDGRRYFDFAGMGVTACTIGYANKSIDNAVKKAIKNGSMGTLNSHEEVSLAENLISIHPWSEMVRFARTGGEACAIAARIARAASGKDHIAFCGYHGWHDWYLSANISKKSNLEGQLLPGLDTGGVPKNLKGTSHPFYYNDIESLKKVLDEHGKNIGTVMMEPQRGVPPKDNFLEDVKDLCAKNNIILIFDEVTSGFHENFGGIHLKLGVDPDMAIFAKAMANGYPLSAVIGKKSIMDSAQDTFISSTMWTERIGFTAGLASLTFMEKYSVQKKLVEHGIKIKEGWKTSSHKADIKILTSGLDSIPYFSFDHKDNTKLMTYFIQEMLKKGFLANAGTATTFAYNDRIIKKYIAAVEEVFCDIKNLDYKVEDYLGGPIKHTTFARLTS